MTQEEKAKRYDEVVNEIRNLRDMLLEEGVINKDGVICDNFNRIFPELKESEDERIKKALIHLIKEQDGFLTAINGVSVKDIIAWLEKQCGITKLSEEEQNKFAKGVLTECALSFIDYLDAHKYEGKMCVSNGECEDIENAFHNAMWDRLHIYYCKYIEKQGEQKPYGQSKEGTICRP